MRSIKQTPILDYGGGYYYKPCGCDDRSWCGLGDLWYKNQPLLHNVTQREARAFQAQDTTRHG